MIIIIGVARGGGAVDAPRAVKKNFSDLIYRKKCVSAPPQDTKYIPPRQSKSQFIRSFCWCTPADKILATPMIIIITIGQCNLTKVVQSSSS